MAAATVKKDAIILAIDIGKNSSQLDVDGNTYFEKSKRGASMVVKRNILAESKDYFALVLFGSSHTKNHLSSQGRCYNNIEIVTDFGVATWDLVKHIDSLSPTNITPSDWISTFVLSADLFKVETKNESFSSLQIVMFSNLATDISLGNLDIIAACLRTENINLTIIGKDYEDILLNPALEIFILKSEATAGSFESVIPKLKYFKQKEATPRAWNVVPLSFGNVFNIRVLGYEKIDETPDSFNWLSCMNHDTQDSITEMKEHTSDSEVIKDGFYFGCSTIIPVPDTDTSSSKSGPRCLQVLGFIKTTNLQRSFLIDRGSYIFKSHEQDIITFNAIFHAMVKREEVMLVRKVCTNNSLPSIGAMFPQNEDDKKYFVYVNLPYIEGEHLYKLPSLESFKPNDEEKNAIRKDIDATNLDKDGNELFMPENTYNPELQSLYDFITQKAINPDKLLTKTIPEPLINLPKSILLNANQPIDEIIKIFSLQQEVSKDCCSVEDNNILKSDISKHCVITASNPIEDFNKLIENGFDAAIVCGKMKYVTLSLIETSSSLEDLKKPASTLKALRDYYINNNDVKSYNNFMYLVKDAVIISGKEDMWSKFIDSEIGLITNQEIEISDISQESSEEFIKHELLGDIVVDFNIDHNPLREFF